MQAKGEGRKGVKVQWLGEGESVDPCMKKVGHAQKES